MSTLVLTEIVPDPVGVRVTSDTLQVELSDGRTISAPVAWFPRLSHGTAKERANFELGPWGIHWPDLNEDISVEGLLRGQKSGESAKSLRKWLGYRARGEKEPIPTMPLPKSLAKLLADEKRREKSRRSKR